MLPEPTCLSPPPHRHRQLRTRFAQRCLWQHSCSSTERNSQRRRGRNVRSLRAERERAKEHTVPRRSAENPCDVQGWNRTGVGLRRAVHRPLPRARHIEISTNRRILRRGSASLPQNSSAYCVQCTACSPRRTHIPRPAFLQPAPRVPASSAQDPAPSCSASHTTTNSTSRVTPPTPPKCAQRSEGRQWQR